MEASILAKAWLFSIFLISAFLAISAEEEDKLFLQCLLSQKYDPGYPIFDAIHTPDVSDFTSVIAAYARNEIFLTDTTPKPLAIITANHESHVQATVACAKENGLQIRIRSGGHDYEGLSYVSQVPFVLLDLFNLRSIDINMKEESAWVESGAWTGELYYKIANTSNVHGFPAAVCTSVGIGGHLSCGGYGNMMRKYGLSVDNVVDAKIVDVNGKILDRESMGEDLFWAIRGGGGGSFGVILSWKVKLVSVPEKVTVFQIDRTEEDGATDLVWKWQNIAHELDPALFIRLNFAVVNGTQEGKKVVLVTFVGMYLGSAQELAELMGKSFPELGAQDKDFIEMRWIESVRFWYEALTGKPLEAMVDRTPTPQAFHKRKSDFVKEPIPKEGLESIWKQMAKLGDIKMQWNPLGGILNEIPETATPYPHRAGNIFKVQYAIVWQEEDAEIAKERIRSLRTFYEAMTPYVSKNPREAFLCYRDIDNGSIGSNGNGTFDKARDYGLMYFKDNFDRLVKVKTSVDPENFFRYEQSIPIRRDEHFWP